MNNRWERMGALFFDAAIVLGVALAVIISHADALFTPSKRDDLSNYRSNAFITFYGGDPLIELLQQDLKENLEKLDPVKYYLYDFRFGVEEGYIVPNSIVWILERFPIYFAFQSVLFANLLLHLFSLTMLFFVLRHWDSTRWRLIFIGLLLSLIPLATPVANIFVFDARLDLWVGHAQRSALFLFFFTALLILNNFGNGGSISRRKLISIVILLLVCLLIHVSMGLLYVSLGLAAFLLIKLMKQGPIELAISRGPMAILLMFDALIIVVAGLKFAIVKLVFDEQSVGFVLSAIHQIVAVNLLVYVWVQFRANSQESRLARLGDLLGNHLLIFGCISLGLVLFNFQTAEIFFSNSFAFFITAVTDRLPVAVHLFWWLLLVIFIHERILMSEKQFDSGEMLPMVALGLIPFVFQQSWPNLLALVALAVFFALYRKYPASQKMLLATGLTIAIGATLYGQTFRIRSDYKKEIPKILNCELLYVTSDSLLEKGGAETYADEIAYYQGIANQLRGKYLPQAQIRDEWVCE